MPINSVQTLSLKVNVIFGSIAVARVLGVGVATPTGASTQYQINGVNVDGGTVLSIGESDVAFRMTTTTDPWTLNAQIGNGRGDVTTADIEIWEPQIERGSTKTNYQRVGAGIYDVTEVGQPTLYGWLSDGDDNFETNAFDPGTDKVTVVAGVRKLSDASVAAILETSASISTNNGAIRLLGPQTNATGDYSFASKGTTQVNAIDSGFSSPISNVVTGIGDISGDIVRLRVNGIQEAESLVDQGTGNFGNHKAYIGGRAGTSLFFNGYIFALCLRFAATDSSLLSRLENFVAQKTLGAKL